MGVKEVILSTGHLGEKIDESFGTDAWKAKGVRIVREKKPLGTGGAVRFAAQHTTCQNAFLCNADTIVELDFKLLYQLFGALDMPMASVVTLNTGVPNEGAIKVERGVITEFCEDGKTRPLENSKSFFRASSTGCYFIKTAFIRSRHFMEGVSLEREILPRIVSHNHLGALSCGTGFFLDYGVPKRYTMLKNNPWILEKVYGIISTTIKEKNPLQEF